MPALAGYARQERLAAWKRSRLFEAEALCTMKLRGLLALSVSSHSFFRERVNNAAVFVIDNFSFRAEHIDKLKSYRTSKLQEKTFINSGKNIR